MKDRIFNNRPILVAQRTMWWAFALLFLVVTALYLAGVTFAPDVSYWGIVFILVATFVRLFILAELFRRASLFRYWLLCLLLAAILIVAMLIKS